MAAYSYKGVLHQIPDFIVEQYEEETGCEYEMGANYDGDGWDVTAMYIEHLEGQIALRDKTIKMLQGV